MSTPNENLITSVHGDGMAGDGGIFCQGGFISEYLGESLFITWLAFSVSAILTVMMTSGPIFYWYYCRVTFEKWQYKSNPQYPSPEKVRDEIIQMVKAVACAAVCPALSVYLASQGLSKAYCGGAESVWYHVLEFVGILFVSDFFEFYYHYLGHQVSFLWQQHRHHHKFFNPSPFSVIADGFVDQFIRATPLLVFPMIIPINMDLMFIEYSVFFYIYGVYLHSGYELDWPDAHHPVFNTAFQHYCHHAKSVMGKPYHCGFFFKVWDNLFGSVYRGDCFCSKCERNRGKRSVQHYNETILLVPDYSVLLQLRFWSSAHVWTGATSTDASNGGFVLGGNVNAALSSDSVKAKHA